MAAQDLDADRVKGAKPWHAFDSGAGKDAVSIMTLHSAKGLEFDCVFLPGWEEGLFPHQRALDEGGRAGLEEERRLAYVGVTRARSHCMISFVSNRRIHGLWQSVIPSRFIDELESPGTPQSQSNIEIAEPGGSYGGYGSTRAGGSYGASRFDRADPFANTYSTPGWQRAQARGAQHGNQAARDNWGTRSGPQAGAAKGASGMRSRTIEGELVAASINEPSSKFTLGDRVFHLKFGNGNIAAIDGNKLTIDFDKAGQKRVLDSFVESVG